MTRFSTLVTPALFTTTVAAAYGGLTLLAGSGDATDASPGTGGPPRVAHRSLDAPAVQTGPAIRGVFAFDVMHVRGQRALGAGARDSAASEALRSSATVRDAQAALRRKGFDIGPIDGVVGPRTASALREFQGEQGLADSGRLNRETLAALGVTRRTGLRSR